MHALHKILVHIPSVGYAELDPETPETDYDDNLDAIRSYAEEETECYQDRVYDSRETMSAGSWEGEYPNQVYIAGDNLEWFIAELEKVKTKQKALLESALNYLERPDKYGTALRNIANALFSGTNDTDAYQLSLIAAIASGTYDMESGFFDTYNWTAKVTPELLEAIKAEPQNWALVMFDYHS